jgi:hypothetical protein
MLTWELVAEAIGCGMLLPAAVAAAMVAAARARSEATVRAAGAIGVAAGWLAAVLALDLTPLVPPSARSWQWLPALAVAAALISGVQLRMWLRAAAGILIAGVAGVILIPDWESLPLSRGKLQLLLAAAVAALWALQWLTDRPVSTWVPAALAVSALAAAIVLERGGTARFAQMAGALAAALVGAAGLGLRPAVAAGCAPVAAVVLPGALVSGWLDSHSAVPFGAYLLAGIAPLAMFVPFPTAGRWRLLRPAIAVALGTAAVALALRAEPVDWPALIASPGPPASQPVP